MFAMAPFQIQTLQILMFLLMACLCIEVLQDGMGAMAEMVEMAKVRLKKFVHNLFLFEGVATVLYFADNGGHMTSSTILNSRAIQWKT